ncbi:N-acetylmuramic acid 6-phosphate etherase [Caenibacillus caldisaponilyticus]|uniref:N-acetylmuramic acid 6-phosphate etherase n=1 Tax=Caenibacillus caldisaponilyticus TaxID=1674942 RepID=UPI001EE77FA9|nr:N-acetylmuramic acid 6-phosphate etherase [Caenibacillus caldisaponilyticus]
MTTESINPDTVNIDHMSPMEILTLMNKEDEKVIHAVKQVIPAIAEVVEAVVAAIKDGGRVFFVGAGTSGRMGVLEAAECPPTFGVSKELFQAVIAGGEEAVYQAVESAEDDSEQGKKDLQDRALSGKDVVIGIAASGKTPYVVGALEWAKRCGAKTVALACNEQSVIGEIADYKIEAVPGPEVISGSTRMKAGTVQKLILNMITTTSMIKLGKVYRNLMVDLHISNRKLRERAINIIKMATGADDDTAREALKNSDNNVKAALVMIKNRVDYQQALKQLDDADGYVRLAIQEDSQT